MQNLLYTLAVVLVILWALGFFVYNLGWIIHILLLIAVIAILLKIIKGKEIL
ncbi:lmo0937 family membrane protein [Flavobacterium sp. N1994]|uniref:lmo0937 family membrane protein n=1 Tax=Flavobacterium sp. N1994 TaxID=2986827 RepID=UPI0022217F64|nr:lmo0937 family membrane protein [Flavobacterium sp. N1994]